GEVISWLKNIGDQVLQDEPVVTVMTDKATVELPSPYAGILAKKFVEEGAIAIKGKPLYAIEGGKAAASQKTEKPKVKAASEKKPEEKPIVRGSSIKATPDVRQMAKALGIALDEIEGSGKEGRITLDDIKNHLSKFAKKSENS